MIVRFRFLGLCYRNVLLREYHKHAFYKFYKEENKIGLQIYKRFLSGQPITPKNKAISIISGTNISGWEIVRKMIKYVWPKDAPSIKFRVVIALGLLIGSKILNVQVPFIFKYTIDYLNGLTGGKLDIPLTLEPYETAFKFIIAILIGYGLARSGSSLFNEMRTAIFAKVAQNSIRRVAKSVFLHLHSLDLSFHLSRQTGALAKAIDRGTRGINFVLSALVFNLVPTILEVSIVTGLLWYKFGYQYAVVTLSCMTCYTAWTLGITAWRTKFRVEMNKADNEAGNRAIDSLINFETVKYFNNESYEADQYDKLQANYERASIKTATSLSVLNFGQNLIFSGALSLTMIMASQEILTGAMTVGDLVLVNGLIFQLSLPLNFLGTVYREVRQSVIDMQAMFSLMKLKPVIHDVSNLPPLFPSGNGRDSAEVTFKDVTFGYTGDRDIVKDLSFHVPAGKKVAIVGGSGCGKSTIIRLLFRFYDPHSGSIDINHKDIQKVCLDSLRKEIGVVPQDTILFHDTILHNIWYGNLKAPIEKVYEAAQMADIHTSIMHMPHQYKTMVGERGLKLSGGEKQRIAIARVILKNPSIFLFDEATSSLDAITEKNIQDSLSKATMNRTSIVIAHRLTTVMDADQILVMDHGRIVERGTHYSLLGSGRTPNNYYYRLWMQQSEQEQKLKERLNSKITDPRPPS